MNAEKVSLLRLKIVVDRFYLAKASYHRMKIDFEMKLNLGQ
jgi:hypothetical protein